MVDWGMVCLHAALWVHLTNGYIMRCSIISFCDSPATSNVKWSASGHGSGSYMQHYTKYPVFCLPLVCEIILLLKLAVVFSCT